SDLAPLAVGAAGLLVGGRVARVASGVDATGATREANGTLGARPAARQADREAEVHRRAGGAGSAPQAVRAAALQVAAEAADAGAVEVAHLALHGADAGLEEAERQGVAVLDASASGADARRGRDHAVGAGANLRDAADVHAISLGAHDAGRIGADGAQRRRAQLSRRAGDRRSPVAAGVAGLG